MNTKIPADPDVEAMIEQILGETAFASQVRDLVGKLPTHPGSAVVCTAELTALQIDEARRKERLVVRYDGVGFALMYNWRRRAKPSNAVMSRPVGVGSIES